MALTQVTGPYPIFTDLDGSPLDDGYLYIGEINQDPETNPIQVYWDSALTIPATQPIRTNSGYAWRNGTPALLYTASEFSITIRNKRQEFVLYSPLGYGFDPKSVSGSVVKNDFIGDGVETNFTLSASPSTKLATNAFINGVYQEKDSYSLAGNVITFSVAPPLGSSIEILTNETGVINAGNANDISYTLTASGATLQSVQTKLEQYISANDFGAVGDGVTDDTAAIQAAIDFGQTSGQAVYLPAADYLVTDSIVISAPVTFVGDGWESRLLVDSAFPGTSDVISIDPSAYTENIIIRDMSIQPVSGTPARYGIGVDITTHGVAYCEFSGLRIAELGNYCFATIPNATPLVDGFFTSVIDRCVFVGGIKLDKAGDSLRITNNTITGPRIGIYVDLQHGAFDGGPHGLLIDGNNITSNGGALYVLNCAMGVFSNNNVEMPTPSGVTNNAMIDLEGINTFTLSVNGMALINNFLGSAVAGYDTIRVNYGRNVLIFGNYVSHSVGAYSYKITANATGTRILQNDDALDEAYTSLVSDAGSATMFERSFGGDWQQTLNLRFLKASRSIKWQDSAGTALSCLQLLAADDYFYIGPDAATALSGGIVMRVNGTSVAQFSPAGNISMFGNGKGVTLKSPNGLVSKTLTIDNAGALVLI